MDRDQYQIAALVPAGQAVDGLAAAAAVQPQAADHPRRVLRRRLPDRRPPRRTDAGESLAGRRRALGKGFVMMSTALDNSGHNCDLALQAESLIMAKEHVVKPYGTLRYTIGTGCSGGSLAEQWIANAYPGIYQGILPTCSFPDAWSTRRSSWTITCCSPTSQPVEVGDRASRGCPTQMGDVLGGTGRRRERRGHRTRAVPRRRPDRSAAAAPRPRPLQPETNPGGIRCTIPDAAINVFGPEPKALWSPVESKLGHGFGGVPVDNVGVRVRAQGAEAGQITPAQFVDLNAKVGGVGHRRQPDREPHRRDRLAVTGQRLPQRHDQRDQQPRPDGDHRLPRAGPRGCSTTPTARSPSAPASTASTAPTPTS